MAYTVQAFHGILQTAARQGRFEEVATMKAKYWRRTFGVDALVTVLPEDGAFFEKWSAERDRQASSLKNFDWVQQYQSGYDLKERTIPLHEYALLGAIMSVHNSKHANDSSSATNTTAALLRQQLYHLYRQERYRQTFYLQQLRRQTLFRQAGFGVDASLLVGLPPVMSRLLNSRSAASDLW